jgi:hypothetical protein
MDKAKSPQPEDAASVMRKIRNDDAPLIPYHDDFNRSSPADKNSYLPSNLVRKLGKETGKFRSDNLLRRDLPSVDMFELFDLIRLEADEISEYLVNLFPQLLS